MRSVHSRSAATVSVSLATSSVGLAWASLMCTWMTAAPAAWHSLAVVTSSSRVTGSAGTADFWDSAPVGATVISVPGPVALATPDAEPAAPDADPADGVWLVMTRRMPPSGTAVQGRRLINAGCGLHGPSARHFTDLDHDHVRFVPVPLTKIRDSSRFP